MAELTGRAAVPTDDGLTASDTARAALSDSAPPHDFLRPAQRSGLQVTRALEPSVAAADPAQLLATLAALLRLHTRREVVTLALRRAGIVGLVTLNVRPEQPYGTLVLVARAALAAPAPAWPQPVHGVLLDLDLAPTANLADLQVTPDSIVADADLYRPCSLDPFARQLAHQLARTHEDAATPVGNLAWQDAAECERVLRGFNALRLPLPTDATLAALISARARARPDAVCAIHGDQLLDFRSLEESSNRLARLLVDLGVGPGRFVAIVDRRGIDFVMSMVAVWKAGGAYIPVDPTYPEDRVLYTLADSEASVAVVGRAALGRFGPALAQCPALRNLICLQCGDATVEWSGPLHGAETVSRYAARPLPERATSRDPAYMIYTSGSTGRPKGAIVRHDGAINHLFAQAHALGEATVARFLQSAPSSSDISVWQFAAPLAFGGTTVIVDDATDVACMLTELQRHRLHLIELVPVLLKYLIEYAAALPASERALPDLRYAMVTGESASVALVNAWLALYPHIPIVNAYGPTEASDDIAQAVIDRPLPPSQAMVPIGKPLANLDLHVLDDRLRPLPVGATGEICVAGVGVGDGYWRQPEKTRAAFVPNPFADHPAAAGPGLYRTGDIGRWRDDGTLECAGRIDHQVQLRGQRIELPEIEAVLREHPTVSDTVAQVFHDGQGDGRLVAFVVPRAQATGDEATWRAHLAARLPVHMVPEAFVRLDALPLNPAGKVDRRALIAPDTAVAPGSGGSPRTPLEALLARLWAEELGVPSVGIEDDFFALGGDSLVALAISVGAREAGWQLRSADVLACPTVAQLATVAQPVAASAPEQHDPGALHALQPLSDTERVAFLAAAPEWVDVLPLTPPQQGIYLHWLLARDKTAYIDQVVYDLDGELDIDAFAQAWHQAAQRHAALRAAFLRSALSQPVQAVARAVEVPLDRVDLAALAPACQVAQWRERASAEIARGFDLSRPPLMRLLLARLGPLRHRLAWTHHHLLLDGWSLAPVLDEVLAVHTALAVGRPLRLPETVDTAPYRAALAASDLGPGVAHWRRTLTGVRPAPDWLFEPPACAERGFGETELQLPESTTVVLTREAARCGVTLTTMLQAAWAVVLAQCTGCSDVVFGVVSSGRELPVPRIHAMVGLFVTTQPLRVNASPRGSLTDWLVAVQQQAAAARAHEIVPLAHVVRQCDLPIGQSLFETLFVMTNYPALDAAAPGPLTVTQRELRTVPAYPLSLIVLPGVALTLRLVHDRRRFDETAVAEMLAMLRSAVDGLANSTDPRSAPIARP